MIDSRRPWFKRRSAGSVADIPGSSTLSIDSPSPPVPNYLTLGWCPNSPWSLVPGWSNLEGRVIPVALGEHREEDHRGRSMAEPESHGPKEEARSTAMASQWSGRVVAEAESGRSRSRKRPPTESTSRGRRRSAALGRWICDSLRLDFPLGCCWRKGDWVRVRESVREEESSRRSTSLSFFVSPPPNRH